MDVAVLGTGYTGLAAALRLLQRGIQVTLIEKEAAAGGLAVGFQRPGWSWTLEKGYHHWFTNDDSALSLAKELGQEVVIVRPSTDVLVDGKAYPFDSPSSLLRFPHLSLRNKLQTGLATAYLKYLVNDHKRLEGKNALDWVKRYMGEGSTNLIWDPLFTGKFGAAYKEEIALSWFWARIKKRTPSLAYPAGGFQTFTQKLVEKVTGLGATVMLGSGVTAIAREGDHCVVTVDGRILRFDKVISTLPTPVFTRIAQGLPESYVKRVNSIHHLSALCLILVSSEPFMRNTYWLNVTDKGFPFLVLAEHTNFMAPEHYGDQHILYVGNYLSPDHRFFKMEGEQLLEEFDPYLKVINADYRDHLIEYHPFALPFAQPVVTVQYPSLIPDLNTPVKDVFMANLDMVYPWDRGTNYAIALGEQVASIASA